MNTVNPVRYTHHTNTLDLRGRIVGPNVAPHWTAATEAHTGGHPHPTTFTATGRNRFDAYRRLRAMIKNA